MVGRILGATLAILFATLSPAAGADDPDASPGTTSSLPGAGSLRPADEPAIEPGPTGWFRRGTLLHDPARPRFVEQGLALELVSTVEAFSNRRGGLATNGGAKPRGLIDLMITFDTGLAGLWTGGTLFLVAQHGYGTGLCEDYVGDLQATSNIDGRDFSQVSEYWLEQAWSSGRFRIKAGKQDATADFAATGFGGDFINSSFGLIPTVPAPTFPDPALGLAAFIDPTPRFGLRLGVYDGAPHGGSSGFSSTFDGEGGLFSALELALGPFDGGHRLPGAYRLGLWYHSDDVDGIAGDPLPDRFTGNYGAWVTIDKLLFQSTGAVPRGIGTFFQFGAAPQDRNEIARYVGGGLSFAGLFRGRPGDVAGLGIAHARLSDRLRDLDGRTDETAIEMFYRLRIAPWLSLQPDVQYVLNPGGSGEDALVVGLRLETIF